MKSKEIPTSPAASSTRAIVTAVALLGGAGALVTGGYAPEVRAEPGFDFMRLWRKARAAEAYRLAHPELANGEVIPREKFVGPPLPARIVVARAAMAERRGGIGPLFGPQAFAGAMNTTVSLEGPIRGPIYRGAPLPNTGGLVPLPGEYETFEPKPETPVGDLSSEIPDQRAIALSRLANPDPLTGTTATAEKPGSPAAATAPQTPLTLRLYAVKPRAGFRAGDDVALRLSDSAASYAAVIRDDATGKASVAFKSPGPSTSFGCLVKTGPTAGSEYYVAVASVKPLNGTDVAQALRTVGMTYASAAPSGDGGLQPIAAWNSAVLYASGAFPAAPAGAGRWQRSEFAVTGASVAVRAAQSVASTKKPAAATKTAATAPAPKPAAPAAPAPAESVLPTETTKPVEPPKPAAAPNESEPPKDPPVATPAPVTPTTPSEKGAKWDLPPTTRRKPGAKPSGATLELVPLDTRDALPAVATLPGPNPAVEPEG